VRRSTGITREGVVSEARSKNSRSTPVACFEKMLKLTPPGTTVAPSGALVPSMLPPRLSSVP
jgi:hypothetical protein